ncbi:unnamed protein product [Lampetra fluviatilis]
MFAGKLNGTPLQRGTRESLSLTPTNCEPTRQGHTQASSTGTHEPRRHGCPRQADKTGSQGGERGSSGARCPSARCPADVSRRGCWGERVTRDRIEQRASWAPSAHGVKRLSGKKLPILCASETPDNELDATRATTRRRIGESSNVVQRRHQKRKPSSCP